MDSVEQVGSWEHDTIITMKFNHVKVDFLDKNGGLELFAGTIYRGKDAAPTGSAGFRFKYNICVVVQRFDELLHGRCIKFFCRNTMVPS
jgi:hypothetical protein